MNSSKLRSFAERQIGGVSRKLERDQGLHKKCGDLFNSRRNPYPNGSSGAVDFRGLTGRKTDGDVHDRIGVALSTSDIH